MSSECRDAEVRRLIDRAAIEAAVRAAISSGSRVVITSGGTGIGPADVTVDAVVPLLSYQVPGICEEIRRRGAAHVASALVSREGAGGVLGDPSAFVLNDRHGYFFRPLGSRPDGEPWWVDLENPPGMTLPPLRIALHGLAVGTFGFYVRGDHNI